MSIVGWKNVCSARVWTVSRVFNANEREIKLDNQIKRRKKRGWMKRENEWEKRKEGYRKRERNKRGRERMKIRRNESEREEDKEEGEETENME